MEDGKDWMNELVSEAERLGLYPKDLKELAAEQEKVRKLREALLECEKQILQERNDLIVSSTNFGVVPPKVDDHISPFINEYDGILSRTKRALKETE